MLGTKLGTVKKKIVIYLASLHEREGEGRQRDPWPYLCGEGQEWGGPGRRDDGGTPSVVGSGFSPRIRGLMTSGCGLFWGDGTWAGGSSVSMAAASAAALDGRSPRSVVGNWHFFYRPQLFSLNWRQDMLRSIFASDLPIASDSNRNVRVGKGRVEKRWGSKKQTGKFCWLWLCLCSRLCLWCAVRAPTLDGYMQQASPGFVPCLPEATLLWALNCD